jgi:TPR repeat protein
MLRTAFAFFFSLALLALMGLTLDSALAQNATSGGPLGDLSQYNLPPNFEELPYGEKVLFILKEEAQKGDGEAMFQLGALYEQGSLVRRDFTAALSWYEKAAGKGLPAAYYSLGMAYLMGLGGPPNKTKGLENVRRAAAHDFPPANFQMAVFYLRGQNVPKNETEGLKFMQKAADSGFPLALNELGVINFNGLWNQRIDKTAAYQYFAKAAEDGYGEAMRNLAVCYLNGEGRTKDQVQALKWFALARFVGYAPAEMDNVMNDLKKILSPTQIAKAESDAREWITAAIAKSQATGATGAQNPKAANTPAKAPAKPAAKAPAKPAAKAPTKKPAARR